MPRVAQLEERLPSKQEDARSNRRPGHQQTTDHRFPSWSGDSAGLKSRRGSLETNGKHHNRGVVQRQNAGLQNRLAWFESRRPCQTSRNDGV